MIRKFSVLMAAVPAETAKTAAPAAAAKPAETKPVEPTPPAATQPAATPPVTTETPVPSTNDPAVAAVTEIRKRAPKNPDNILNIINGRLPLPLVFAIRFLEAGHPTSDVAKRYGTSIGKVFDIFKGRNFGYITEAYAPSAEEMNMAKAWISTNKTAKGQTLKEAGGDPDGIAKLLENMKVATNEEVAKRNWQVKQFGATTAPTAAAPNVSAAGQVAAAASVQVEKPAGAKLF